MGLASALLVVCLGSATAEAFVARPQDAAGAGQRAQIEAALGELERAGGAGLSRAVDQLAAFGAPAAERVLESGFAEASLAQRRARIEVFARAAGAMQIEAALGALGDPDDFVRARLIEFLAAPRLGQQGAAERVAALERSARGDPNESLRLAAAEALAKLHHESASAALERLLEHGESDVQRACARALCDPRRDPERLLAILRRALGGQQPTLGAEALATLVAEGLGEALARSPAGGEVDADVALFAAAARRADGRVRAAATVALSDFVDRCTQLGDWQRADAMLARAVGAGLDDFDLLVERARLALQYGGRAQLARDLGAELVGRSPAAGDTRTRIQRAAGRLVAGAAATAAKAPEAAAEQFEAADELLAALAREGAEARLSDAGVEELDALVLRVLTSLHRAVALLAAGRSPDDTRVLEAVREADLRVLHLQHALLRWVTMSGERRASLDDVLFHDLGPAALYFSTRDAAGYSRERWIEVETGLYQALANVTRGLVPGFAAGRVFDERLRDPLLDEERRAALESLRTARHKSVDDALARRVMELERQVQSGEMDPSELIQALTWQRILAQRQQEELLEPEASLLRQREFSRAPLAFVERLRENGRSAAARSLAERVVEDLEALRGTLDDAAFELVLARAGSALGGVLMDQDEPVAAEEVLQRSLTRLEALEKRLEEDGRGQNATLRSAISGVLVSLAVNANVKSRDPAKALAYFERAYELDQSEFMRVLLACYRARAGRGDEARAVMRDTRIGPGNYYNAACTWALLGERELALDYLRRDFDEMRTSAGARQRQKEWARTDPDLEALRSDPRFLEMLAPEPQVPSER